MRGFMTDLARRHCNRKVSKLSAEQASELLPLVPGFATTNDNTKISKRFKFENFHETMAFVNALAFIAHKEDHHPDLELSYGSCVVSYGTHDVGGLSENDFICAAKVNALLQ